VRAPARVRASSPEDVFVRSFGTGEPVMQGCSCPPGSVRSEPRFSGETEGRVQVARPARVAPLREEGSSSGRRQGPEASLDPSLRDGSRRRTREGSGQPGPRWTENTRSERTKAQESIGPETTSGSGRGTDPRREQNLEAAGHRDLLVLRARERDVRNGRKGSGAERRTALRGGKALKGETPRVAPILRDRKATEGVSRQEGGKPWRRNEPGWTPG